jgi:hypothetical protein
MLNLINVRARSNAPFVRFTVQNESIISESVMILFVAIFSIIIAILTMIIVYCLIKKMLEFHMSLLSPPDYNDFKKALDYYRNQNENSDNAIMPNGPSQRR